jgi:hypothetical protein
VDRGLFVTSEIVVVTRLPGEGRLIVLLAERTGVNPDRLECNVFRRRGVVAVCMSESLI